MTDDELRQLVNAATTGPWRVYRCSYAGEYGENNDEACGIASKPEPPGRFDDRGDVFCDASYDECHHIVSGPDAAFIAAARTEVPRLLDEVSGLREEVARLRGLLADALEWMRYRLPDEALYEEGALGLCKEIESALKDPAVSPSLRWSREAPTSPGEFWLRVDPLDGDDGEGCEAHVAHITKSKRGDWFHYQSEIVGEGHVDRLAGAEWAGPIAPPSEPPKEGK